MQFTPNIKERYAAALRNIITKRVMKGQNTPKNFKLLKIILIFSALVRKEIKENIELTRSIEKILKKAALNLSKRNINLVYKIKGEGAYKIDYPILKLLILESVFAQDKKQVILTISFSKTRIIITSQNAQPTKILKCLVRKLNGVLIKERGESNFSVLLSAPLASNDILVTYDIEDLSNPFSVINIMLFQ